MYTYIFGPVPSRRRGRSLGVDLVPHRACSLDCVYCEVGPTTNRTLDREEYLDVLGAENKLTTIQQERGLFYQRVPQETGEKVLHIL